jgi:hypothetical protein
MTIANHVMKIRIREILTAPAPSAMKKLRSAILPAEFHFSMAQRILP